MNDIRPDPDNVARHLRDRDVEIIVAAARWRPEPILGIGRTTGTLEARSALRDALVGAGVTCPAAQVLLAQKKRWLPDPVSAALIESIGLDPVAVCTAALLHAGGIAVNAGDDAVTLVHQRGAAHTGGPIEIVLFARGTLQWIPSESRFILPVMPETLVNGLSGQPLRRILSHPALDLLNLTVNNARTALAPFGDHLVTHVEIARPNSIMLKLP